MGELLERFEKLEAVHKREAIKTSFVSMIAVGMSKEDILLMIDTVSPDQEKELSKEVLHLMYN